MDTFQLLCIILGGIVVILLVLFLFVNHKYSKTMKAMKNREVDNVVIKDNVRLTVDQTIRTQDGEVNVSLSKNDILLEQSVTYTAAKESDLKPGKYAVLSTHDGEEEFNIRIGKYVKNYKHGDSIVLHEGQEITPVSTSVILR